MARTDRSAHPACARASRLATSVLAAVLAACATQQPPPAPPRAAPAARVVNDFGALRSCVGDLLADQAGAALGLVVQGDDAAPREALAASVGAIAQRGDAVRVAVAPAPGAHVLRGALRRSPGVLAIDLGVYAADGSALPGGASSHAITLRDDGADLRAFGTSFKAPRDAGDRAALQALADVATAEAVGRLARVAYWRCFGAANDDPAVLAETQRWYDALAARPAELIGWFQRQLRARQLYDGEVDGRVDPAFKDAVARYRAALGLAREPKLTLDFFRAHLAADPRTLASRIAALPPAAVAQPVEPQPARPLALQLVPAKAPLARGEAARFTVRPSRDAYVYCYHQDEQRRIRRFFPNRFQHDARVPAGTALQLPGDMRFEIVMNARGTPETVACFATESDVSAHLPSPLAGADFAPLPLATMEQLRGAFADAAQGALAQDSFELRMR